LTIFGQYLVQHYFAALDGKRFLLSDITHDLSVLADTHIRTPASGVTDGGGRGAAPLVS